MDKRICRLETFTARGSDGKLYAVHGYEHQRRMEVFSAEAEQWESTGVSEYKLPDGRHVDVADDGSLVVADSDLRLRREDAPLH